MGLVVEADRGGDVGNGLTGQQPSPCGLDAAPGEVAVGRQPERRGEAAHEVGGMSVQYARSGAQGESVDQMSVEQVAQVGGEAVGGGRGIGPAEMRAEAFADEREAALGGEPVLEAGVQLGDAQP